MAEPQNTPDPRFDQVQKRVSFFLAIAAFLLSLYNFANDHLLVTISSERPAGEDPTCSR